MTRRLQQWMNLPINWEPREVNLSLSDPALAGDTDRSWLNPSRPPFSPPQRPQ